MTTRRVQGSSHSAGVGGEADRPLWVSGTPKPTLASALLRGSSRAEAEVRSGRCVPGGEQEFLNLTPKAHAARRIAAHEHCSVNSSLLLKVGRKKALVDKLRPIDLTVQRAG